MRYELIIAPEAVEDLHGLKAHWRAMARDAMEKYLRYEPARENECRIKHLRGMSGPQFRLRVGDIRIFYDVSEGRLEILAIIPKSAAAAWLESIGEPE
jgi:mRNA interferase RelE/StbE